jgi:hypothetical protein
VVACAWQEGKGNRRVEAAGVDVVARHSGTHGREEARGAEGGGGSGSGCFNEAQQQQRVCRRETRETTSVVGACGY